MFLFHNVLINTFTNKKHVYLFISSLQPTKWYIFEISNLPSPLNISLSAEVEDASFAKIADTRVTPIIKSDGQNYRSNTNNSKSRNVRELSIINAIRPRNYTLSEHAIRTRVLCNIRHKRTPMFSIPTFDHRHWRGRMRNVQAKQWKCRRNAALYERRNWRCRWSRPR